MAKSSYSGCMMRHPDRKDVVQRAAYRSRGRVLADGSVPRLASNFLQAGMVADRDGTAVDRQSTIPAEMRQHATDRLNCQPEMIGNVRAAHGQIEDTGTHLRHALQHFQ